MDKIINFKVKINKKNIKLNTDTLLSYIKGENRLTHTYLFKIEDTFILYIYKKYNDDSWKKLPLHLARARHTFHKIKLVESI